MNRNDIAPLLQDLKTNADYQRALNTLRGIDEVELFYGLFPLAMEAAYQTPERPSYAAGNLLFDLNPACPISCGEAIEALVLSDWNISLEEVPYYVYRQFGMAACSHAMEQLQKKQLSPEQQNTLDTVQYWVRCAHGWGIELIVQRRAEDEA